ncbi:MAG: glycosyltransferase [Candidatus Nitrosopelagicus sp.]|jgi:cellulose synthase/poly-beta-1,6-N-acetylglucosamine synthase-like glycosyltransferase|nr:glycosyltransferase [Candidatus Nitrosopelagicus sp.]
MSDIAIDVFNYIFTAILIGVFLAWISLIFSMYKSFTKTPYLDRFENSSNQLPKVSIILPARNEEKFIGKCLKSFVNQDYTNYEIMAIDDSSDDKTWEIIEEYAKKSDKIIPVKAKPKPDGWMGKNWACMEGFKHASGDLMLFTDADTTYTEKVLSFAVAHLLSEKLDVLTVIPRLLCLDNITKITLPMLSTFLHSRYSALNVNNPKKGIGYFFGSFFIIKKEIYEKIGTHEKVKHEIIEDGALGKITKESGFRLKMVRGEHLLDAVYSRSPQEMWNGLERLMVPLYHQNKSYAVGVFFAVLFILFIPIPFLIYSVIFLESGISFIPLLISAILSTIVIFIAAFMETKMGLSLNSVFGLFAPLGGLIVTCGFLSGILQANKSSAVSWRGRKYSVKEFSQNYLKL